MLTKHSAEHTLLAEALLEHETLTVEEMEAVMKGKKLEKAELGITLPHSAKAKAILQINE